ncbi:MAG: hypothetical protein KC495_14530, partial [Dehalococcoidia bacterium]|nr:hypothetical protein [Dehalococcoidia bacterium]
MAISAPRLFVFGLLILGLLTVAGDRSIVHAPQVAQAAAVETFSIVTPAKVYSGIPSHRDINSLPLADADPTLGNTGYCVFVQEDGHSSIGGNFGFSVENGIVLDADYFDNGSTTTTDDVYCVVVQADRITTELPRPKMRVIWTYLDGGVATSTTLDIEVV